MIYLYVATLAGQTSIPALPVRFPGGHFMIVVWVLECTGFLFVGVVSLSGFSRVIPAAQETPVRLKYECES